MPIKIIIAVLLIGGVGTLLYPMLCNMHNQYLNQKQVDRYTKITQEMSSDRIKEMWEEAKKYNENHMVNNVIDVFEKGSGSETEKTYEGLLDPTGTGMMGYLEIPEINLELVIYHGTEEKVLEEGCGHMAGSSLPVGGNSTHCVLAGHRGLPTAKLFTDLDQLKEGDQFYIHITDKILAYEIDQIKVVKPDDLEDMRIWEGKDYVTLLTCTPYGVNSHRLLVRGYRVPYIRQEAPDQNETLALLIISGLLLLTILIALAVLRKYLKAYRKEN